MLQDVLRRTTRKGTNIRTKEKTMARITRRKARDVTLLKKTLMRMMMK